MTGFSLSKHKAFGILSIILLWTVSYKLIGNSVIMPSPGETAIAFKEIIISPSFLPAVLSTLSRIMISFLIALGLAFSLGIISATNQWFYDFLSPAMGLFKIVPTMAIVILALIWLTNQKAPILIAVILVLPILYEAVVKGIKGIDPDILSMLDVYQVEGKDIVRYIYIPSILKSVGAIFSSAVGLCLKIVIGGEVLGQPSKAIGTSIQTEKMYLNTAGVLGWIIILVILSLLLEVVAKLFITISKALRRGLGNEYTRD